MRKKILSILLTLCMVLALMPATMAAYASETHSHCICGASHRVIGDHTNADEKDFTAWDTTDSLPTVTGNYYLTVDVNISETWEPANGTVLCLNGHTIKCTGDGVDAITINNNGVSFTLTDCKNGNEMGTITHETGKTGRGVSSTWGTFNMYGGSITGNNSTSGGGVYIRKYSFNMYGGSITGNTATSEGGGVSMFTDTFNMSGGSITGNTSNKGGGVSIYGTFNMSGGSITDNTATSEGGGVCYSWKSDTFNVSGNVNISSNKKNSSGKTTSNNVTPKSAITISGALANESSIGVNRELSPWDSSVDITGNCSTDYSSNFTSDDPDYTIYYDTDSNTIKIKMHDHIGEKVAGQAATCSADGWIDYYRCTVCNRYFEEQACTTEITDLDAWKASNRKIAALGHDWKYSANGAVLTASCSRKATCQEADKTLTLSTTSPTYSGNAATINIGTTQERTAWEAAGFTLPTTVEHYSGTTKLDSAPTTAGAYTAKVTYEGATASVNYTITDKPHTHSFSTAWTTDGTYHWHVCTAAGCDGTVSGKAEHTAGDWITDKEATTEEEGSKHKACTVCGYVMEKASIPKLTPGTPAFTEDELNDNSVTLNKKTVVKWKKNKLTVSWGKVSAADGYDIFAAQCGKKLDTKSPIATVKGRKTSATISMIGGKKVSEKNTYKVKVKAYILIDGKKYYIGDGQTNHVTGKDNKTYTNAKTVEVSKKSVSIKKGKTSQIKATIVKESKNKKLLSKGHATNMLLL